MKTAWLILFSFILLLPSASWRRAWAEDDWWAKIQRAGEACFSGRKFKVEIIAGAAVRTLGDRAKTGPFSEIRLTVPLFDKEKSDDGAAFHVDSGPRPDVALAHQITAAEGRAEGRARVLFHDHGSR